MLVFLTGFSDDPAGVKMFRVTLMGSSIKNRGNAVLSSLRSYENPKTREAVYIVIRSKEVIRTMHSMRSLEQTIGIPCAKKHVD